MQQKRYTEDMLGYAIIIFLMCASVLMLTLSYYCYKNVDSDYPDSYEVTLTYE